MKVLHIAETVKGGIESYLEDIDAEFVRKEIDVHYILPHTIESIQLEKQTIIKTKRTPLFLFSYFKLLLKEIRDINPDIIHLHSSIAGGVVRLIKAVKLISCKIVYCPHGWPYIREDGFGKVIYKCIEKILGIYTDKVIAISSFESNISVVNSSKVELIPNGVFDIGGGSEQEIGKYARNILYVGRFDKAKGVDLLISSFNSKNRGYVLNLVGESVLNDIDIPKPENSNIIFHGWKKRHELRELYLDSWAVIIPSRWDGFNLVAVEAMSCSRPVYATNVGGLKGLVNNEVGKSFDINDLNDILDELMVESRDNLMKKGLIGRDLFLKEYHIERVVTSIVRLYEDINK